MARESVKVSVGEFGRKPMPWSEVCMHMRISGQTFRFVVITPYSVQLYRDDGEPMTTANAFSGPITTGEAGLYQAHDDAGVSIPGQFYYYPEDIAG